MIPLGDRDTAMNNYTVVQDRVPNPQSHNCKFDILPIARPHNLRQKTIHKLQSLRKCITLRIGIYLKRDVGFPELTVLSSVANDCTDICVHVGRRAEQYGLPLMVRCHRRRWTTAISIPAGFGNERRTEDRRWWPSSGCRLLIRNAVDW